MMMIIIIDTSFYLSLYICIYVYMYIYIYIYIHLYRRSREAGERVEGPTAVAAEGAIRAI